MLPKLLSKKFNLLPILKSFFEQIQTQMPKTDSIPFQNCIFFVGQIISRWSPKMRFDPQTGSPRAIQVAEMLLTAYTAFFY